MDDDNDVEMVPIKIKSSNESDFNYGKEKETVFKGDNKNYVSPIKQSFDKQPLLAENNLNESQVSKDYSINKSIASVNDLIDDPEERQREQD